MAGADAEPQPAGRQLVEDLHLLRGDDGMPGIGRDDGRAEDDAVGLHGGGGEEGQGIEAGASGGEPRGLHAGRFRAAHEIERGFGIGGAGMDADPFGGHGEPR